MSSDRREAGVVEALEHNLKLHDSIHKRGRLRSTPEGHWINEAFVVRVYAILEVHGVVQTEERIDQSLPGWKDVDLCRRLRHKIAHATGEISSRETETLLAEIKSRYGIGVERARGERFPLPKDKVLWPMHRGCLEYSRAFLQPS